MENLIEPGTVSCGTMRNSDLISAFMDKLRDIGENKLHAEYKRAQAEYLQLMQHLSSKSYLMEDEDHEDWLSEEMHWLVDDIFDALDGYAPENHYFGAHPGDGSDYGYWENEE